MSDLQTQKSWFSRTEGKFGTAFTIGMLVVMGATAVYFWGIIVPWVVTMLQSTLTAAVLAAVIFAIGWVVFDPRWRNLVFYGYKSLMRLLTSAFIEIDPIGILKTYVKTLTEKLQEMDASIASLNGQRQKLRNQIDKNEHDRVHNLQLAQQAQKHGDDMRTAFVLKARQAGRLQQSNLTLQNLLDRMDMLGRVLTKMRGASAVMIEDIQGEVDVKTQERAALLAGYNAFSKAKKIMDGAGDDRELFDMTMAHLTDDYGQKMGEIETFMDMSKGFIQSVDLDNGIFEEDALAQLDAWEKKGQSLILGTATTGAHSLPQDDRFTGVRVATPPALPPAGASPDAFSDLFEDKSDSAIKTRHQ